MYGLEVGQVIELEYKRYDEGLEQPVRGKRKLVKEPCTIVQICPNQIIVQDRMGFKRGVAIGELIVRGIIKQEGRFQELRAERQDNESKGKRGKYKRG